MFAKRLHNFYYLLIVFSIFFSALWAFRGDIIFHTDIGRDFLVLEQMVLEMKPTLIGARSSIPGVFHGPLWLYMNLPAFIIGGGNPAVVGWFWVVLTILAIGILYYVGKKLFNKEVALLASVLYSASLIPHTKQHMHPFGTVMFFPLYFYFFSTYLKNNKVWDLVWTVFVLGLLIQLEVALGMPMLILTVFYLVPHLFKRKKLQHLLAIFVILIPLSTHILFELRHDFFQTKSLISFVTKEQIAGQLPLNELLIQRVRGFFLDGLNVFPQGAIWMALPIALLFVWLANKTRNKKLKFRQEYLLFFYLYLGFWLLMFGFKGEVWNYYYWPFLPVIFLIISSVKNLVDKRLFYGLFALILVANLYFGINSNLSKGPSWNFYHQIAQKVYQDANNEEFGYYVYTADLLGYSEKYALHYTQKEFKNTVAIPYQKRRLVYLFVAPPPGDKPHLNGDWWKENQVKIDKKPAQVFKYADNYKVEKYVLTPEEIAVQSDPNLIQDLTFR